MNTLLRVEGVNIANVLEDTDQLSVIRGGSLLLREAVKEVPGLLGSTGKLRSISTGASVGLFEIESGEVGAVREMVANALNKDPRYQHLTFVVDCQTVKPGQFNAAKEGALARNRFRQLEQLSVALPPSNMDVARGPCAWDDLRPADADATVRRDNENRRVSSSVWVRYDFGQEQKVRGFYAEETGKSKLVETLKFARDLHEISDSGPYRNLDGKIAVIYLDGNRFSDIQTRCCTSAHELNLFDKRIRSLRSEYLRKLLKAAQTDTGFKTREERLRLETLLWGGDEMTLVVPAWKGLWTLLHFYDASAGWNFNTKEPLTHAGGLVLCDAKTPIARTRALAKELADHVKQSQGDRRENQFLYMVLESVDFPAEPVKRFWETRYGDRAGQLVPIKPIAVGDFKKWQTGGRLDDVPKGQVYELARAAIGQSVSGGFDEQRDRFAAVFGKERFESLERELFGLFGGEDRAWTWLHLTELWDYLVLSPK